jgi:uncharacterized protein YggE
MTRSMLLLVMTTTAWGAGPALAQPPTPNLRGGDPASIRVVGEATLTVPPDRAEVDIGVTTEAQQSSDTAARNAAQLTRVLQALRTRLGSAAAVETISYSLLPQYRPPREGAGPVITGYRASNVLRVTLDDLNRLSEVIDTATGAGANHIQRVRFTLAEPQRVQARALSEAAANARTQADALAAALGVRVLRILSAEESAATVRPLHDVMALRPGAAASATPIEAGTIDVQATISLTLEIAPR